jgi:hypothetical protein
MPDFFLIEVSSGVIFMGQREYYGGSGILAPLVIKMCRNYGDISQSFGTP